MNDLTMNNLNKKSVEELKKLEEESRTELFVLRFQAVMGELVKTHRISELKKLIARILTILSARKKVGENTQVNIKVDSNKIFEKVQKESEAFVKQRKAKIEQMMGEQQGTAEQVPNLMDLPLDDAMDLESNPAAEPKVIDKAKAATPVIEKKASPAKTTVTKKAATSSVKKTTTVAKDGTKSPKIDKDATLKALVKEKDAAKKAATAKSKTVVSPAKTKSIVKSVTSAKAEVEVSVGEKKADLTKTAKKSTELKAKGKLDKIKSSVATMSGTAKGRGASVKIDLDIKTKDPKANEYTYGTNWKENRDKILTTEKTTKKTDDKTAKKGTGKK